MNGTIWIAEDDPLLRAALVAACRAKGWTVVSTDNPGDARLWLSTPTRPVILDGSVWRRTGVPLERLSPAVVLFTGSDDVVEQALAKGVRVFTKGNLSEYRAMWALLEELVG